MNRPSSALSSQSEIELIIGNSNPNFSGVTSTMLQVLHHQKNMIGLRVMGKHYLPDPLLNIGFLDVAKLCRKPLADGRWRVFHARRVDEMIQALLLKYLFRAKIKIVFSSAAQRHRAGFTRWLTRRMDAVVATCNASARYLSVEPDAIVYHGVREDVYVPAKDKTRAWQALNFSGKYGIAILGRVRKQKGVHLFVEACIALFSKYPLYTAIVVGPISTKNKPFVRELIDRVAQAGLSDRIIFTGELPVENIPGIYSSLSLVAALSDNEGFGLTVLEAMSSGAAVLATEAGAWKEIVANDVDGYIVPVNDLNAVIEKMDKLLADPGRLIRMGDAGRKKILKNYTVEREAQMLCDIFRKLQTEER